MPKFLREPQKPDFAPWTRCQGPFCTKGSGKTNQKTYLFCIPGDCSIDLITECLRLSFFHFQENQNLTFNAVSQELQPRFNYPFCAGCCSWAFAV